MKKLKLQLDQLAVESFTTSLGAGPRGTVQAHATEAGSTCEAVNTCGPQTCVIICIYDTQNPNLCGGGTGACSAGCTTAPTGQLSCDGCTTYDYTANAAHDSCGACMSFESDSPQRCRCI